MRLPKRLELPTPSTPSRPAAPPHLPSHPAPPHAAYLSSEALSLLKGLLQKDATKRLGCVFGLLYQSYALL